VVLRESEEDLFMIHGICVLQCTATHCNTLQHTATHCNTLQHTATHCNTLQHMVLRELEEDLFMIHCIWVLQHTATLCSTLQHTATHGAA